MSFIRLPTAGMSMFLGASCAALLFCLALLTTGPSAEFLQRNSVLPSLAAPSLPAFSAAAPEDRAAAEKPLFHVDRKPFVGRLIAASEPGFIDEDATVAPFTLKGVLLSDSLARASLYSNSSGEVRWINRGEIIDGWKLVSVNSAQIVLARNEHRTTLKLYPARTGQKPE